MAEGDGKSCFVLLREPGSASMMKEGVQKTEATLQPVDTLRNLSCSFVRSSPDGTVLAVVTPADVALVSSSTGVEICKFAAPGVTAVSFSPKGSFLLTFQKPDGKTRNLVLRSAKDGAVLWSQFQKSFLKTEWPTLVFTADEALAYRTVTGEIQFFSGPESLSAAMGPTGRLKAQGLGSAAVSPSPASHVAAFFPSLKGAPASVRVYSTEGLTTNSTGGASVALSEPPPLARRSFFKATTVRFLWSGGAKGVLVWTHSDVDKTNQSYYGDSALHYLSTDGTFEGSVPLGKDGPIHDVQWSPSGKEFVVVHGYMPAKAILFDAKCKPLFDFGSGPRNIIRWNPHSHFILLAGFGNLPGDIEFWDREKLKLVGSNRAACGVSAEWAPHGRTVLVATTAPRLQVDNGVRIFKYDGTQMLHVPYKVLLEAEWLPAPAEEFPDRPPSPGAGGRGGAAGVSKAPAAAPYRPPGASATAGASLRAKMSGEADKPRHLGPGAASASADPSKLSKSALKNLKKKQSRAAAAASGGDQGGAGAGGEEGEEEVQAAAVEAATKEMSAASVGGEGANGAADKEKRIRNLSKKLKQIDDLKLKDRAKLEPEQLEKLKQEASMRAELAALQS